MDGAGRGLQAKASAAPWTSARARAPRAARACAWRAFPPKPPGPVTRPRQAPSLPRCVVVNTCSITIVPPSSGPTKLNDSANCPAQSSLFAQRAVQLTGAQVPCKRRSRTKRKPHPECVPRGLRLYALGFRVPTQAGKSSFTTLMLSPSGSQHDSTSDTQTSTLTFIFKVYIENAL